MQSVRNTFNELKNSKLVKSWVKVFLAALFSAFLADLTDVFAVTWSEFQVYITAGVAALLPVVITWLDPSDDRFGVVKDEGSDAEEEGDDDA